jgi:hypothetical protein
VWQLTAAFDPRTFSAAMWRTAELVSRQGNRQLRNNVRVCPVRSSRSLTFLFMSSFPRWNTKLVHVGRVAGRAAFHRYVRARLKSAQAEPFGRSHFTI